MAAENIVELVILAVIAILQLYARYKNKTYNGTLTEALNRALMLQEDRIRKRGERTPPGSSGQDYGHPPEGIEGVPEVHPALAAYMQDQRDFWNKQAGQ